MYCSCTACTAWPCLYCASANQLCLHTMHSLVHFAAGAIEHSSWHHILCLFHCAPRPCCLYCMYCQSWEQYEKGLTALLLAHAPSLHTLALESPARSLCPGLLRWWAGHGGHVTHLRPIKLTCRICAWGVHGERPDHALGKEHG